MLNTLKTDERFDIRYIDPSSISSFARCPARYMLSRQMGLQQRGRRMIAPDFGTCMHAALPYCYKAEELPESFSIFDQQWNDLGYSEGDEKRNILRGHSSLMNFASSHGPATCQYDVIEVPSINMPDGVEKISRNEQPFLIDIGASLPLAGRIDLLARWHSDGKIYPLDYKGQPLSSLILTPHGFIKMGDVKVGTIITGANGNEQEVLGVFPLGKRKVFKVTFSDKSVVNCTWDHLWKVKKRLRKKERVIELKDIVTEGVTEDVHRMFEVPERQEVCFYPQTIPLDPYVVGCLLGNGCKATMTSADKDIIERIERRNPGMTISVEQNKKGDWKTFRYGLNGIKKDLQKLGMLDVTAKHRYVPVKYLLNSAAVRREVLKGLMDTAGSVLSNRTPVFTTTSPYLVQDVKFLTESLGGLCTVNQYDSIVNGRNYGKYYMLFVQLDDVFSLDRKRENVILKKSKLLIASVDYVDEESCQCIKVSNKDGLYITDNFIVTHNTSQEVSQRLFNSFWNAPQPLAYTLATAHLTGELPPGLLIEAIRVSKNHDEVQLCPVDCPENLIERFVEYAKMIAAKICICNETGEWPMNCAACSTYAMFGMPGYSCDYQPICGATDWKRMVPMYEQREPWHPFVVKG